MGPDTEVEDIVADDDIAADLEEECNDNEVEDDEADDCINDAAFVEEEPAAPHPTPFNPPCGIISYQFLSVEILSCQFSINLC